MTTNLLTPPQLNPAVKSDSIENSLFIFSPCILKILLQDRTTGRNIFWATDSHAHLGKEYEANMPLRVELIKKRKNDLIRPRAIKAQEEQTLRTKKKAEVFTPSWLCNQMNNYLDADWFGGEQKFNIEKDKSWETTREPIEFPEGKTWKDYVKSTRLEITCGEAPFLVSRYDTVTGNMIPVRDRIGLLDRKLRVVSENVDVKRTWVHWAYNAFKSVYGYEYQGDNLILARENLLFTFIEYMVDKFGEGPTTKQLQKVAEIISWNIWQMDGLTKRVPYRKVKTIEERQEETKLFDYEDENEELMIEQGTLFAYEEIFDGNREEMQLCKIANWEKMKDKMPEIITFESLERGDKNEV